jgi:hypothetical protein
MSLRHCMEESERESSNSSCFCRRVEKPGVKGAIVVDRNGLTLAMRGSASEGAGGPAKLLAERAKQVRSGVPTNPNLAAHTTHQHK